ncbi:MAG: protein tyrosine phosphatase [Saprospiraceae bacterium]|nr:protein tyrosine phosphatase [Lewinella sp.]
MNVLFICSRNQWRSRTAETIFRNDPRFQVRSAGTSSTARIRVNSGLINWADLILVMEHHHKERLMETFGAQLQHKEIMVLEIPDNYQYMDAELVDELKDAVDLYFESRF